MMIAREQAADMADAHAEGWHAELPREGCPECEGRQLSEYPTTVQLLNGRCEQGCGRWATVYAIDPIPDGWGGRYCRPCAAGLRFQIVDELPTGEAS